MNRITILGATGSIGQSTLDVIARHKDRFEVVALTAHRDVDRLFEQCLRFRPRCAVMADESAARQLRTKIQSTALNCSVLSGVEGLCEVASLIEVDTVVSAIVGAAGLLPTLAAVDAGKKILLANKEALVMAGELMIRRVNDKGGVLLPVDSEHNAIFQCLQTNYRFGVRPDGVSKVILTASGGPFHADASRSLETITPAQAVAHPNWQMGRKISVDSATFMNKGLEVIEARWLFGVPVEDIDVVVHPQSIVHSMVAYRDGSLLAQMGTPDMRIPIVNALAWPVRIESGVPALNLFEVGHLDFLRPQVERFPCLNLARRALTMGGTAPVVLNAANEVAVSAFLSGQCRFTEIPLIIEAALDACTVQPADRLETILAVDQATRSALTHRFATAHAAPLTESAPASERLQG